MIKAKVKHDGDVITKVKGDNVIMVSIEESEGDIEVNGFITGEPTIIMDGISMIVKNLVNEVL